MANHCGLNATKMAQTMPVMNASPQAMSQKPMRDKPVPTLGSSWPVHCAKRLAAKMHSTEPKKPRPST